MALKLEPEFADAWAEKAAALQLGAFDLAFDPASYDAAREASDKAWIAARRATQIEPRHPLGLAVMGGTRSQQKRWIEARVFLERAVSVKKPSDNAYLWLGILRYLTGDPDGAFESFDAGLELSPTAPNLIRWRTYALVRKGRWREAWEARDDAPGLTMADTIEWRQIAGLRLGEISIDDYLAFLSETEALTPEQISTVSALLRKYGAGDRNGIESADLERLLSLGSERFVIMAIFPEFTNQVLEETWRELLVAPNRNILDDLWLKETSDFRSSPEFAEVVRGLNLPAYWDLYGWPDVCRPVGASDFVCDQT